MCVLSYNPVSASDRAIYNVEECDLPVIRMGTSLSYDPRIIISLSNSSPSCSTKCR